MASVGVANAFVFSLFLCTITVHGNSQSPHTPAPAPAPHPPHHHHHHHHAPSPSPIPPPSHIPHTPPPSHIPHTPPPSHYPHTPPPSHSPHTPPPSHSPPTPSPTPSPPTVSPPSYTPPAKPKAVAVQGVVYCKSCKYRGIDTLQGGAPLAGAVVKLQCNNTKNGLQEQAKTDKNGYFFFMPQKLTTNGSHKCKVFLVSSPAANCSVPTNLHAGAVGAILMPPKSPVANPKLFIFTVGPFAFEPHKKLPCY